MPKVLTYITAYVTWVFLFYGTDVNENRAHVHVGKKKCNFALRKPKNGLNLKQEKV